MDFLYDGSFDGLLTALFYAYPTKKDARIYRNSAYETTLFSTYKNVDVELDKADRVFNGIRSKLSPSTLKNVYLLYLSEIDDVENLILDYIRLCFKYGAEINLAKNNEIIRKVDLFCRKVTLEVQRFYGFIRFKEIAVLTFYAPIEPDHNILPLLGNHFKSRFSDQRFIIHDLKRRFCLIYDLKELFYEKLSLDENHTLLKANVKDSYESLFATYFKAATLQERINKRQQHAYMPIRYFKHLVEI